MNFLWFSTSWLCILRFYDSFKNATIVLGFRCLNGNTVKSPFLLAMNTGLGAFWFWAGRIFRSSILLEIGNSKIFWKNCCKKYFDNYHYKKKIQNACNWSNLLQLFITYMTKTASPALGQTGWWESKNAGYPKLGP